MPFREQFEMCSGRILGAEWLSCVTFWPFIVQICDNVVNTAV